MQRAGGDPTFQDRLPETVDKQAVPAFSTYLSVVSSDTPLLDAENTVGIEVDAVLLFFTAAAFLLLELCSTMQGGQNTDLKYHFRWDYQREMKTR